MDKAILRFALVATLAACRGSTEAQVEKDPPPTRASEVTAPAALVPTDAGAWPQREQAAATLMAFAEELLADDIEGARSHLRIPDGYTSKQLDYYLQELRAPQNMSAEGVSQIVLADFGPLAERFGEQAGPVAEKLGLPLESTYAFGDSIAAALLHWDGKVFRVAALHRLSKP